MKRLMSLLIAVLMVVGVLPVVAFADATSAAITGINVNGVAATRDGATNFFTATVASAGDLAALAAGNFTVVGAHTNATVGNFTETLPFTDPGRRFTVTVTSEDTTATETYTITVTTVVQHQVTFTAGANGSVTAAIGGTSIGTSPAAVNAGSNVVFTAAPNAGYRVAQWTVGGTVQAGNTSNTLTVNNITAATAVNVTFEANPSGQYTLTIANAPAGGTAPTGQTTGGSHAANATVTLNAGTRTGYTFVNWTASPSVTFANANQASTTFTMPAGNVTVTANWRQADGGGNNNTNARISRIASGASLENGTIRHVSAGQSNPANAPDWVDGNFVRARDELLISLSPDLFEWESGNKPDRVTRNMLSNGRITVGSNRRSGFDAVSRVSFTTTGSGATEQVQIRVEFVNSFSGTRDRDFDVTVFLQENGRRHTGSELRIRGSIENPRLYIEGRDSAYLEQDGNNVYLDLTRSGPNAGFQAFESDVTLRRLGIILDHGVTVYATIPARRTISISSNINMSSRNEEIYLRYPNVVEVINIVQSGLNTESARVAFDVEEMDTRFFSFAPRTANMSLSVHPMLMSTARSNSLFAYDSEGRFLGEITGRGTREFAFSPTYFITDRRINMNIGGGSGGVTEPTPPTHPGTPAPPSGGSGGSNNNWNPGTGRKS